MADARWARRMAATFQTQAAAKTQEATRLSANAKLKREWGSKLWTDLRDTFQENARLFNFEVGEEIISSESPSPDTFILASKHAQLCLTAAYDSSQAEIHIEVAGRSVPLEVAFDYRHGMYELRDAGGRRADPEEIAETLIAELLEKCWGASTITNTANRLEMSHLSVAPAFRAGPERSEGSARAGLKASAMSQTTTLPTV